MNYIGGVTSIKLRHYVLSLFGILPGTVLYCFIGATTGNLLAGTTTGTTTEEEGGGSGSVATSPVTLAATIIGIVLGLAALFVISNYAKKEFNKIVLLSQQQQQQQEEEHDEHEEEEELGIGGARDGDCVNSYHNSYIQQ